jgi:hypothetical protein
MIHFIIYSEENGLIQSKSTVPYESDVFTTKDNHDVIVLEDNQQEVSDDTHYVDLSDLSIKEKMENPAYLQGTKILEIPKPSFVYVTGKRLACTDVDDGFLDIEVDLFGRYTFHISPYDPSYLSKTLTVDFT